MSETSKLEMLQMLMKAQMEGKATKEKERQETSQKIGEEIRLLEKEHGVEVFYVLTDMGEYTNQWINLAEETKKVKGSAYLHYRGIVHTARLLVESAPTYPPSEGISFNTALLALLQKYSGFPLYVLARYNNKQIHAHINMPSDVIDFYIAGQGIKHLVQEFFSKD